MTSGDLLLGTESTNVSLAPGESQTFGVRTLTIPASTAPGNYFIGLLADRTNAVAEGRENNNTASVALTVTAAISNAALVVTTSADAGAGSLRAAITAANAAAGLDTITFAIPTTGTPTIGLTSALPTLTGPVVIDGRTRPGAGTVVVNGSAAGTGTHGLTINAGSSTIRGLVIQGFGGNGILITGAGGNLIEGNFIGTDSSGLETTPNGANGVQIVDVPNNTIGGSVAASRNVISGNNGEGVRIDGANATGNIIIGNYIGVSASGSADMGNAASGVFIRRAPGNSVIGNVVSGNGGFAGVAICGNTGFCGGGDFGDQTSTAQGNVIQGNFIGTAADGTTSMGNNGYGVSLDGTPDVLVGGQALAARNVIAFSGVTGVVVFGPGSAGNTIMRNSIHSNVGLGIDLGTVSGGEGLVTPNDLGDADNGPNRLQNFPVLESAVNSGGSTNLQWSLNTTANTQVVVDFFSSTACDASGNGEGQNYIASVTQTSSPSGDLSFTTNLPGVAAGMVLTAVATSAAGGTSEFSNCATVIVPTAIDFESPALGANNQQLISPYSASGVTFTAEPGGFGDEIVGLVKNNGFATSACVPAPSTNQLLGTGRTGLGTVGFSSFSIRATFAQGLGSAATVSVTVQTLGGQTARIRLFNSADIEIGSGTAVVSSVGLCPNNVGGNRGTATVSASPSAGQIASYAIVDIASVPGSVFVIDMFTIQ